MKNVWIIGSMIVLGVIALILGLSGYDVLSAGDYSLGYISAGRFSAGVFSAGLFSVGIFSVGVFSIGIFSLGIFNIAVIATGIFMLAWKKCHAKVKLVPEEDQEDAVSA